MASIDKLLGLLTAPEYASQGTGSGCRPSDWCLRYRPAGCYPAEPLLRLLLELREGLRAVA